MLAQNEIANELLLFLLRRLPVRDFQWNQRRVRGTSDVVVTAPLKLWHVQKTIAMVYRDAYNNQLNDRYLNKWNEYGIWPRRVRRRSFRSALVCRGPATEAGRSGVVDSGWFGNAALLCRSNVDEHDGAGKRSQRCRDDYDGRRTTDGGGDGEPAGECLRMECLRWAVARHGKSAELYAGCRKW